MSDRAVMAEESSDLASNSPCEGHAESCEAVGEETYGEKYYMQGKRLGISNYENYRWMPEQTLAHAIYVQRHLRIEGGDTVLDVGCAKGYFVKALRMMGVKAFGYDISKWAIANCDPEVTPFVSNTRDADTTYDWITVKDVCEHIEKEELIDLVGALYRQCNKGMLIVVPLTYYYGGRFARDADEMDKTHVQRWTLTDWMRFFMDNTRDFTVSASFYIKGIKEACLERPMSTAFITLTRI